MDWVVDLGNQFNNEQYNFQAGMKEVIKSLYGCTELCDECKGEGCENASAGYSPIIEPSPDWFEYIMGVGFSPPTLLRYSLLLEL